MPLETQDLLQTAVLWPATATEYDNNGELKRGASVSIKVRWPYVETDGRSPQGVSIGYDGTVIVDRDITVGSIMFLGTLSDYENASSPTVFVVTQFSKTPDVKNRQYRRKVLVQKHSAELPALIT